MKGLARLTGFIFVILGILAFLGGVYMIVRGFLQPTPFMPSLFGTAEAEGMLLPLRLLVGAILSLQGLMLAALGEGLWLVASMADASQKSSELLATLAGKGSWRLP